MNIFVKRKKVKVEKWEETDDEVVFVVLDERGDIAEYHRFRKPHSTYVDWWIKYLDQRLERLERLLNELSTKVRK